MNPSSILRSLALLPLLAARPAPAQPGLPSGAESVLIGRVYHRGPSGTIPVGHFGLVLPGGGEARASVDVARREGDPASGYVLELGASRRRGGAHLSWSLRPSGSEVLGAREGELDLQAGVLGHLALGAAGGTAVHASVELGRASSFDAQKLARHFGLALAGAPAPRAPSAVEAVAPARLTPVPARAFEAPAAPRLLELGFRLERDGEPVFAPRIRVREGEGFTARSARGFEAAGERWDGFELSGSARLTGGRCLIDLSVQTGRRLDAEGPETWLVDRYRSGLEVPAGRESVVELFEDLDGASAGRSRLFATCAPE